MEIEIQCLQQSPENLLRAFRKTWKNFSKALIAESVM